MKNLAQALQNNPRDRGVSTEFKPNHRILVVEDEREIAKSYQQILAPQQLPGASAVVPIRSSRSKTTMVTPAGLPQEFELTLAHDVETALALVKKSMKENRPFAMGFFDVLLGGGEDGFDLVKKIRELDPEFLAVFVTAYNDRSIDSIQGLLGAQDNSYWDYLNKPFSASEILQKARNFTSLWNMREEKRLKEDMLADLQEKLLHSERFSTVAAVARGVNHEFGNILMQIMGKADMAKNATPERMKQALETILDATGRASDILDRFKHLASGSSYEGQKVPVDLVHLVDEATQLLEHALKTHQTKICKIKIEKAIVPVHATSILQVLVNLMINSMHAMGPTGQIDISIRKTEDGAEICLRDYGPGIPVDLLEKVKEPFFTTKGENGTGLGLAICSEIVEVEHLGEFVLQNHGVKGLEVRLRLPLSPGGGSHENT